MLAKSVFPETFKSWNDITIIPSLPFFVSRSFVPRQKWNLTLLVHQNTGKENRYQNQFFYYSYQYIVKILSSKQKNLSYTL